MAAAPDPGAGPVASAADHPAVLPPRLAAEKTEQLAYVCHLLRSARQPLCPANGVLAVLPFDLVQSTPVEAEALQQAARSDVLTVQRELRLRVPVTSLMVGMEQERGFRELVRRVGRERAASQRFGRNYDLRCVATTSEMRTLTAHVCGAFEDWAYTLFREQEALRRPGNLRLYGLLCKVRCNLKTRLAEILANGFGYDERQTPHDQPFLFSGCYFAATGKTPDRQAFVKGVFDKLVAEQEQIEWTDAGLAEAHRRRRWAAGGMVLSGLLAAALIAMLVWH